MNMIGKTIRLTSNGGAICQYLKQTSAFVHTSTAAFADSKETKSQTSGAQNNDYSLFSPNYKNRNPKNLEWSGDQYKRFGWNLQYPPRDFYNRIVFRKHSSCLECYVEHSSGDIIASLSTRDLGLRSQLFSATDLCAAKNLAVQMANICARYGLTHLDYLKTESFETSKKEKIFFETLIANGITLEEAEFKDPRSDPTKTVPGLDLEKGDFFTKRRNVPFPPDLNKLKRKQLEKLVESLNKNKE